MSDLPKISIITVVRNGEKYIEHTIKSIAEQSYNNLEYIVIDGNSTDDTIRIIKKYDENITYWISEKDEGIYDAMNKGILASTGDWLLFINSDDFLADNFVIEKAAPYLKACASLVAYGNAAIIYQSGPEFIRGMEWDKIKSHFINIRMNLSHQSIFHSKQLFASRIYDKSFKITGDYDLLLSYLKDHNPLYIPLTISKMRTTGVSATVGTLELLKEIRKAQIKNKIYKFIPSISWIVINTKLFLNNQFIQIVGIKRKDNLKRFFRRMSGKK